MLRLDDSSVVQDLRCIGAYLGDGSLYYGVDGHVVNVAMLSA